MVRQQAAPTRRTISVNGMVGPAAMIASGAHTAPEECSVGVYKINTSNWYVEDASGTVHPLPPNDTYIGCTGHGFTDQTLDYAFKVTVTSTNIQVWANDGSTSGPGTSGAILSWTDKNGNVTSVNSTFTSWKDPMNGIVPLTSSTGIGSSPSYSWTDINGGTQTFAMASIANYIKTSYGCPSPYEDQTGTNAIDLVTSVSFPDGSSLGIAYEPNGSGFPTGRISELTLPTGGTVAFAYSGFNCTYAVPTEMTMTTTDGTWTYTWAPVSYGSGTSETYGNTLTVKDPAGNSIVHTYIGLTATNAGSNTFGVFEVERQSFPEGSSTAGMTTTTCYNGNTTNCLSTNSGPLITSLVSTTTWAGMSTSQEHAMTLDLYGDVLTDTLYNFSGTQYNETVNTFNATAGCSSNANAPSLRCTTESLYSGSEVSAKTFTYDASSDALTINSWLTGNTGITTTNTYYTNGTLHTSLDPGGVTTTYTYGDCDGFMPTKIALSSTLYTSFTYGTAGCDGGVPVTSTDANGNVTHLDYSAGAGADPYYRQLIAVDPQGNYHYHEYSPTNTVAYMQFASSMDFVAQEVDGYGRVINVQKENGPSSTSYDTGSVAYGRSTTGGLGYFVSGYTPCVAGYYSTCEGTLRGTFQNDYLGRPSTQTTGLGGVTAYTYSGSDVKAVTTPAPSGENTKAAITESNGLWSTITCPIVTSTLPAGVSCGTAYLTGTRYPETSTFSVSGGVRTYTTTRGLQSHTRTVDSLGRTITESYPESNTVHYYYDAQSPHGCPTSNGRLTERDDTKGNEVCYTYDAYGRLTKTATNGTQCRQLFYDNSNGFTGTIPSGVTVGNPYGHLVEAATTNCSSTLLTDEWMSYDSLGRVNNAWESTPHSGGYYHATETYFPNNLVNVEALGTALSTTYSVDGEGH